MVDKNRRIIGGITSQLSMMLSPISPGVSNPGYILGVLGAKLSLGFSGMSPSINVDPYVE